MDALDHLLLGEVPVGLATQRARQTLVALLVARVAHRVVEVPARTGSASRRVGATVTAHPAVLQNEETKSLMKTQKWGEGTRVVLPR